MASPVQVCTFYADGMCFGIGVLEVQEVLQHQPMVRVPLSSPVVQGLLNLRGQVVTAVDLRRRLGLPDRAGDDLPVNVVVRGDDGAVSLLVDEIGDVVEVHQERVEPLPDHLRERTGDLVTGVVEVEGQLLLLLDAQRAIDLPAPRTSSEPKPATTRSVP